jgi:hypothetical protein
MVRLLLGSGRRSGTGQALSIEKTVDRILRFFKHLFEGVSVRTFVRVSGYRAPAAGNFYGVSWLEIVALRVVVG